MSQLVDLNDLITSTEAAALLLIKNTTLEIWRVRGKGPAFLKFGDAPQAPVRYRRSVVLAWRDRRTFRSTSAYSRAGTSPVTPPDKPQSCQSSDANA